MSGSIFDRERLRPVASPTLAAAVGRFQERARPVRRPDPRAPETPFFAPRRPDVSSDLADLAASLSRLNPAITGFLDKYYEGRLRAEGQEADAAATQMALREDIATWAQAVAANPSLADRSPYFRQIFEERLARQAIIRRGNQLHAEYWGSEIAGSADPAAIQQWLRDRMGDVLDQFRDSPAQRAAAAEELRNQALALIRTHQQNAARNLVQQNEDSLSSAASTLLDTFHQRGGAARPDAAAQAVTAPASIRRIYERVAQEEGLPVELLMAQGFHESGGFHPDVLSGRRRGSRGEIGLAQVLPTTAANPGYGLQPISEQDLLDPEKAIRFQARYLKARGAAVGVRDWNDPRQAMLGLAAYNGTGPQAQQYARTVMSLVRGTSGGSSDPANAPGFADLAAELQRLEAQARAQGVDGRRINQIMTNAVAQAMIRHGRMDYEALALMPRPDGTPGFGTTAEGRATIEAARMTVLSRTVQEENLAFTRFMRARQMQADTLAGEVAATLIEQLRQGQTPQLTPEQLQRASSIDPDLVGKVVQIQNHIRGVQQQEDPQMVATLELAVNVGEVSPRQVLAAFGPIIRDPQTFTRLLNKAMEAQAEGSIFRNPVVTQIIRETQEAAAGLEASGILKNHGIGVQVGNAMREAAADIERRQRAGERVDMLAELRKRQAELIQAYNPSVNLPGYDPERVQREGLPGRNQQSSLPRPNPSVNWRRVPVFNSVEELEQAYRSWRQNPTDPANPIAQWIVQGNVNNPNAFYDAQRRLLSSQQRNTNR